ncbi:MAG: DEAD/DEAH box helicase [Proteobacteria bacterium]|nr:DEAD/DEAH box helicase [Pseudomonadota bacterium]MBU1386867.1 DEAD/DEAH box helicase [Pseudomonadota bacterium]MBU1541434.1 DEAD/DEAH box helicase [Pseudomonadota bacterium]MBU2431203.1 DEAD/DEAH box helicase [Pseudomonadota bacterium]MBU2480034.1 DEAD/DEAH box helicase [Pseudomonadota bacterium]
MSFDELGLRSELLSAVKSRGYTAPTPIQNRVIPAILGGKDILARAQTGTGKTDAFVLPLVEILSRGQVKRKHPRALVLAPTRELALQVGETIKAYGRRVSIRCTVVYGGVNIGPQIDRLKRGIDVLVATPGRLLDLAEHRDVDLSGIDFLVFDEADRMLDLGFSQEISQILDLVPMERRTMLFSATYTQQIRNLANQMLKEPDFIEETPDKKAAEAVIQKVHLVDQSNKRALLIHLITRQRWEQALVFVRTKHGANKLTEKLAAEKISAAALHGNKSQSFRTRTLNEFKQGQIRILVATDVAARGLDISNLPHVVNYDMPKAAEDYIHRIGRTGRAGVSGIAISFVSRDEKPCLKAIEKLLGYKIPEDEVGGFTEGGKAPDFVLYRPNDPASEKKADKALKELVDKKKASKSPAKALAPKPKPQSETKNKTRSRTFFQQSSKKGGAKKTGSGKKR